MSKHCLTFGGAPVLLNHPVGDFDKSTEISMKYNQDGPNQIYCSSVVPSSINSSEEKTSGDLGGIT